MRILGVGDWNDLGDLYMRLAAAGHEVRVHIGDPRAQDILEGMIHRCGDWRAELPWIRAAGNDGVIVFETAYHGPIQDALRADGYQVIGGCACGDRLEADRAFGQRMMAEAGMKVMPAWEFATAHEARTFIRNHPARYVLKHSAVTGADLPTYVGRSHSGSDVAAVLELEGRGPSPERILLSPHIDGVEVGVGAYFNGERFLEPACLDWEHKSFFPGGIGELTGEMGTLVTYRGADELFSRTLARCAGQLRAVGYVGYINLNTIVDGRGVWPLEFTCRFGYPGYAILDPLQSDGWPDLFRRLLDRGSSAFATLPGFAVGIVVTVPPFPYPFGYEQLGKGTAIDLSDVLPGDADHLHFAEVARHGDGLVCSGHLGCPLVVTGIGSDAACAQREAYQRVERVVIANMRYRNDIASAFIAGDEARMRAWGWLASC